MQSNLYLETSIVSYLTGRPSRDIIAAAHQQLTQEWWETRRQDFSLYISQLVIQEASAGDKQAAMRRLNVLKHIPLLEINEKSISYARDLIKSGLLPEKATEDSLHVAVATIHGMDYFLTWNCNHIANAKMRHKIEARGRLVGYKELIICTPEELLGG